MINGLSNFGFKCNLRRYILALFKFVALLICFAGAMYVVEVLGRVLHPSAFQLNVSALCGIGGVFRGCCGV